jgi:RNA polymerase sigma-70 factor, ECF subfamily
VNVVEAGSPRYRGGAGRVTMPKHLPISSAQETLLAEHRERLLRYTQSMVRDRGDAEDVLQETLLRAHRGFASLRAGEAATTWLFRIATRACLDHLRQRVRRPAIDADVDPDAQASPGDDPATLQATMERREMSACVQRFLEALPDEYRSAIMLTEIEGLTGPEISDLLGVKLTTVKMRLHRARRMLQEQLEAGCSFSCDERGALVCEPKKQ